MRIARTVSLWVALAVVALLGAAACSSGTEATGPTEIPVGSAEQDDASAGSTITIENTSDSSEGNVIIYQQPVNDPTLPTVAWFVVPTPQPGDSVRVDLTSDYELQLTDSDGNFSTPQITNSGEAWQVYTQPDSLKRSGSAPAGTTTVALPADAEGAVTARLLQGGKAAASKFLTPGGDASFALGGPMIVGLADRWRKVRF